MARTPVPVTKIGYASLTNSGAGTALDPTNGHVVSVKGIKTRKLWFRATQTAAATKNLTVKAGGAVNTTIGADPAWKSASGDLVLVLPATTGDVLFTIDPARHMQSDGTILMDVAAAAVGALWAWVLPDAA